MYRLSNSARVCIVYRIRLTGLIGKWPGDLTPLDESESIARYFDNLNDIRGEASLSCDKRTKPLRFLRWIETNLEKWWMQWMDMKRFEWCVMMHLFDSRKNYKVQEALETHLESLRITREISHDESYWFCKYETVQEHVPSILGSGSTRTRWQNELPPMPCGALAVQRGGRNNVVVFASPLHRGKCRVAVRPEPPTFCFRNFSAWRNAMKSPVRKTICWIYLPPGWQWQVKVYRNPTLKTWWSWVGGWYVCVQLQCQANPWQRENGPLVDWYSPLRSSVFRTSCHGQTSCLRNVAGTWVSEYVFSVWFLLNRWFAFV